ncbi:hypothetical protein AgCh_018542 [Apium graveolens]
MARIQQQQQQEEVWKFKILPTPKFKPTPVAKTFHFCSFKLGFGYDGFCNDYKIVRIVLYTAYARYKTRDFVYSVHVEMYSANEDSWKEIEIPESIKFFKFYPSGEVGVFLPQTHGLWTFDVDCGNVSWTKQFNIENRSQDDLKFLLPPGSFICTVAKYSESLVSLEGFEELE